LVLTEGFWVLRKSLLLCLVFSGCCASTFPQFEYIFPIPGSCQLSAQTSIIIRLAADVHGNPRQVIQYVQGGSSGVHNGLMQFYPENRIVTFHPATPFVAGERVAVCLKNSHDSHQTTFTFTIASHPLPYDEFLRIESHRAAASNKVQHAKTGKVKTFNGVTVPSDFPDIQTCPVSTTAPGRIFFSSTYLNDGVGNYLVICDNDGTPYFYRRYDHVNLGSSDFKMQPAGVLSAFLFKPGHFIVMDHSYAEIDSFKCGDGYRTDSREFVVLSNGHALLIADDPHIEDMSALVQNGKKEAVVVHNNIQEVNDKGQVFFQWRSKDHFTITDAIHENLASDYIDYVHLNSIAVDYDGNYIISSRNLCEITKINSVTGGILWRLGGVHNQFDFINDEYGFSYQHDCRPVPEKPNYYTIFDNGVYHEPNFSRALELKIDPVNMTAEKIWEFRYQPDRQTSIQGSVQRLANGNSYIDWSTFPPLHSCEVTASGQVIFSMDVTGVSSYRSRRYEWDGMAQTPYLVAEPGIDRIILIFNKFGDTNVKYYKIYGDTHPEPTTVLATSDSTKAEITGLQNNTTWYFRVTAMDTAGTESGWSNTVSVPVNFIMPGENLLHNGDFSEGGINWLFSVYDGAVAVPSILNDEFHITISDGGGEYNHIQLAQENIPVIFTKKYKLEFDAWADASRAIEVHILKNDSTAADYSNFAPVAIGRQKQHYQLEFIMKNPTDPHARLVFNCGGMNINTCFDNVSLIQVKETTVQGLEPCRPMTIHMDQNFPNPFNLQTKLTYTLAQKSFVTIEIYNTLGEKTMELAQGWQEAQTRTVRLDASRLSTGIYFYRIHGQSPANQSFNSDIKKMIVLR
jgi:hypothetical protein